MKCNMLMIEMQHFFWNNVIQTFFIGAVAAGFIYWIESIHQQHFTTLYRIHLLPEKTSIGILPYIDRENVIKSYKYLYLLRLRHNFLQLRYFRQKVNHHYERNTQTKKKTLEFSFSFPTKTVSNCSKNSVTLSKYRSIH